MSLVRQILEKATKGATKGAKPFYSAVDKAILDIVEKQPKATGDQYLGMILKAKGVKPAEIKDRGIDAALKGKGKMSGKDLVKTAEERPAPQITGRTLYEDVDEGVSPNVHYGKEDYSEYRTPGGQNYREILISLPQENVSVKPITAQDLMDQGYEVRNFQYDPKANKSSFKIYDKDGNLASYRKEVPGVAYPDQALIYQAQDMSNVAYKEANKPLYKAPHFGQQGENLLAHARVQDMRGPNGEKILLIDEIQSDWHQAGRKQGYRTKEAEERYKSLNKEYDEYIETLKPRVKEILEKVKFPKENIENVLEGSTYKLANLLGEAEKLSKYTNDLFALSPEKLPAEAPFKNTWHELTMKRLVDDAARKGYDKVVFSPASFQKVRYPESNAEKFFDLLYDQKLPKFVSKEYGVEVGQYPVKSKDLSVIHENRGGYTIVERGSAKGIGGVYETREAAEDAARQMNEVPYHSFDITPEMREGITTQGQPLYQLAPVAGAVGAGMMATDEEVPQYKKGGPVSMDAMRLAVLNKRLRK